MLKPQYEVFPIQGSYKDWYGDAIAVIYNNRTQKIVAPFTDAALACFVNELLNNYPGLEGRLAQL